MTDKAFGYVICGTYKDGSFYELQEAFETEESVMNALVEYEDGDYVLCKIVPIKKVVITAQWVDV